MIRYVSVKEASGQFADSKMPLHHRDPFDRMLVAQSIVEQSSLVSVDPVFDSYGIDRIW